MLLGTIYQVSLEKTHTELSYVTLYGLSHWTCFLNHQVPAEMLHRAFEDGHIDSTVDKLKQPTLL
jgi:hypothetical protein